VTIDARAIDRIDPQAAAADWLRRSAWIGGWWLGSRSIVFVTAAISHSVSVLAGWDGHWYRTVASDGYLLVPGRQSDPAFFPLYPSLLRIVHSAGIGYETAGLLIANLAFLGALVAFHALTRDLFGDAVARRATKYVAIFPCGYVFSMAYPESLVLAAIALAGLAAVRGRWGISAAAATAAAIARPEGVFLAIPLAACAYRSRSELTPAEAGLAFGSALAPLGAFAAFPLYLDRVIHDPVAWSRAERAWGRHFSPLGAIHAVMRLPHAFAGSAWIARDAAMTVLYVLLLFAAARMGAPRAWLAAGSAVVILPLFSGSFDSIGRFGLLAPPVFWGLAGLGRRRPIDLSLQAVSIALLVAATATVTLAPP
jgi:hypothetical protein